MLALLLAFLSLAVALALAARVATLSCRVRALETGSDRRASPASLPANGHLHGLRIEFSIHQDHPLNPFEATLAGALAERGAVRVDADGDVRLAGTIKGNGYADVYFDADLAAEAGGRTLLRMRERPPHGDRPENLARELVARLEEELARGERQGALRELGP